MDGSRMELFGIRLVGINAVNGQKLLLTVLFIAIILGLRYGLSALARLLVHGHRHERALFWMRQGLGLFSAVLLLLGGVSIWFDNPTRLTTAAGLVTAGLAFALQKVVTSVAAYFVILRGKNFSVGDRISMGGVRGDVIALGFIQTTIMEMGQPPAVQDAIPPVWVKSRQFTGRIVTVSNGKIFDEPVYNYTRDFPYLWEEITVPIRYTDDRSRAEQILLETAEQHTLSVSKLSQEALRHMQQRYFVQTAELDPKVFYRLTDNWLELTVRFVVYDRGVREVKDAMSREILADFDRDGIHIASATYNIGEFPPLRLLTANGVERHTAPA
jgi:small-conductance mechanosensitive channel